MSEYYVVEYANVGPDQDQYRNEHAFEITQHLGNVGIPRNDWLTTLHGSFDSRQAAEHALLQELGDDYRQHDHPDIFYVGKIPWASDALTEELVYNAGPFDDLTPSSSYAEIEAVVDDILHSCGVEDPDPIRLDRDVAIQTVRERIKDDCCE